MGIVHNQLPEGEDPYVILKFDGDASLKVALSFEGDFTPLVAGADSDGKARSYVASNVFALVWSAFGGEASSGAESSDGETA